MARSNSNIALYMTVVFVSGVAVGAGGLQFYNTKTVSAVSNQRKTPEEYRKEYVGEMRDRLKLDQTQVGKLITILDKTHEDYTQFRARNKPEMQRIQQEQIDSVNALLNDTQKQEYEKMRAEREARRKAKSDRGDGGF